MGLPSSTLLDAVEVGLRVQAAGMAESAVDGLCGGAEREEGERGDDELFFMMKGS